MGNTFVQIVTLHRLGGLEVALFKCLVCGFLSEKYEEVDRHIRKEHPRSKVSSIPWIHETTREPEKEITLEPEKEIALDPRGIVQEFSQGPFKRYFREILQHFTNKDLDELMLIVDQEKQRRKKKASKTDSSLLVP